ncbi:radical SAM protein [Clostridium sp. P21]|uniref:Radical SAM protein n=1 Tax=Clostridium muellerianum TaxID=2716538 RepID=A0A7Y0EM58_9CLOT|nr:radical SAM protein [Clostridium muellerianum]NMM65931.1 radical SAM protein [Clostridium muellerianum]
MKDDMMKVLSLLNSEKNYESIIDFTSNILMEHPDDIKVYYCLAMAYIAKGDKTKGLKHLQNLITQSLSANKEDKLLRLFINQVILQTIQITELSLHGGDVLGANTIQMVKEVKLYAHKLGERDLEQIAENILKRWIHINSSNQPIVALIPDSPLTLQVEPTNACNLNCTMCPRSKMTRKVGFMDTAIFDEMLDGWKNRVIVKQIQHLIFGTTFPLIKRGSIKLFFMGEPLIHNQLDKLIESGKQAGCTVGIQTNGITLVNKEVRQKLLSAKPSVIGISLDGINEMSYEAVRQGARLLDIYNGLKALHKEREEMNLHRKIWIMISSIIPKWNQSSLEHAQKFLEPIRPFVDHIGFIPLSRERDPKFYDENGKIILYSKQPISSTSKLQSLCLEPFTKLNVLWDGSITPCCYDINCAMPLGHIKDGIDNVWKSSKVKELQDALLNQNIKKYHLCSVCMSNTKI